MNKNVILIKKNLFISLIMGILFSNQLLASERPLTLEANFQAIKACIRAEDTDWEQITNFCKHIGVNQTDSTGRTILHYAARYDKASIVERLIKEHGARINIPDLQAWTPLHIASREGYATVVEELLRNGADVNQITERGSTPMHLAAWTYNIEILNALLHKGAKINAVDRFLSTPLDIVRRNFDRTPIPPSITAAKDRAARFLQDHGATDGTVETRLAEYKKEYPMLSDLTCVDPKLRNNKRQFKS